MLKLDTDQQEAVDRVLANPQGGCVDISDVGTGKTEMAIAIAKGLGAKTKLVIAPPGVIRQWKDRILKYYPDDTVNIIESTKAGKENLAKLLAHKPGWYLLSRGLVTSKSYDVFNPKKPFDFVAFDECMRMSNRKGKTFSCMKKIQGKFKHAMGATPYGNRFENSWALTHWVWGKDGIAGNSFWRWADRFCNTRMNVFTGFPEVTGEKLQGEYFSKLPNVINIISKYIAKPYIINRYVKLGAKERKAYNTFRDNAIVFLENNVVTAKEAMVIKQRLRMMSLGLPDAYDFQDFIKETRYDSDGNTYEELIEVTRQRMYFQMDTESAKFKEIKHIIDNEIPNEPVVIFTSSRSYAQYLAYNIEGAVEWHGQIRHGKRLKHKDMFIDGEARIFVAQIASVAEGVDGLQTVCHHEIWADQLVGDDVMNEQARGRLSRRGQSKRVVRYNIIAEDTNDEETLKNNKNKKIQRLLTLDKKEHL